MKRSNGNGKTALVTGATGFIGSHLVEDLVERGYTVKTLIRETSNTRWIDSLPVEFVVGSLSDIDSLKTAAQGVDVVYHVAGVVAAKTREGFYRGNVAATKNLLEAVRDVAPDVSRFVHVSSLAAIGPAEAPDKPVDEEYSFSPITRYGESKAEAERVVHAFQDILPVTIVRPPAVYGPRDVGIHTFFQFLKTSGFAPLIGFGDKRVSLVHVRDLVHGFVLAGESSRSPGETYFISSEEMYSWEHVGDVAAKLMGKEKARYLRVPHPIVYAGAGISGAIGKFRKKPPILDLEKGRDIMQAYWICSIDKAKRELGFSQNVSIEEGVKETLDWYIANNWL